MKTKHLLITIFFFLSGLAIQTVDAQNLTLPPSGNNQKSSVTQWFGPVSVNVTYNSPDVSGPDGASRKGQIWGGLVPFGMADNSFGSAKKMPWRAGANENTIITFSHDVKVEGKDLRAGSYGLHMIPGENEWTVIFSKNFSSWGSYFYDEKEDALRVNVTPKESPFSEWLTYEFVERMPNYTVCALRWEELMVPFKIESDVNEIYLSIIRDELRSSQGFSWQNWVQAASFCVSNNINLEEALLWADNAINMPFIGEKNFTTLQTKASVLFALGRVEEADTIMEEAMNHPTADMSKIHFYARSLIAQGRPEKAMEVFELNRKKNPKDNFTTLVGLARGYEATGKKQQAIKYYKMAAENAPDGQKDMYLGLAKNLETK